MRHWYFRHARSLVYFGFGVAAISIAVLAYSDSQDTGGALVEARQEYGLWALALLLASMIIGPIVSVLPWLPLKAPLMYARRAVGVSAILMAALHVACYVTSFLRRSWHELYSPGVRWVLGLLLGLTALALMAMLALTSNDAAVRRMGGRRWKRLHRAVYALLGIVLLHAMLNGADFGLARAPDVTASPDAGALFGFLAVAIAWLILFVLRRWRIRWTPGVLKRD